MKAYGGVEVYGHSFLTLAPYEVNGHITATAAFLPVENLPGTQ